MNYYYNPKCSKSREGLKILKELNQSFKEINYLEEPLDVEQLNNLLLKLQKDPIDIIRKKEKCFEELKLESQKLNKEQWLEIISKNPILLERPILEFEQRAFIVRPAEKIRELIS